MTPYGLCNVADVTHGESLKARVCMLVYINVESGACCGSSFGHGFDVLY